MSTNLARQPDTSAVLALALKAVGKRFPGVVALDNVDLDVWSGEVHGLVGENGAGKSTLIKTITGAERPDTGEIRIFGDPARDQTIHDRRASGVSAIYQELTIVPHLSAAANVLLGNPPRRGLFVRRRALKEEFLALARRLGLSIDPDAPAGELSVADRQMIEIMRALATDCRVLIMDEPTATLGPAERAKLYEVVRELRMQGVAIIYISHDLDEVLELSDRISVMRAGRLVATDLREGWSKERMVGAMIGEKQLRPAPRSRRDASEELLRVEDLRVPGRIDGISFSVNKGEIVGIAGLVGAGRTEVLRAIAGADPSATGRLTLGGMASGLYANVRSAIRDGIVLVPEDRKRYGFVPLLSGVDNVALTDLAKVTGGTGVVRRYASSELAKGTTRALGFNPDRLGQPVGTLSGGNQQKLVIGKWLHRAPRLLLLDEPTRGVDIGAKAEIYASIRALADQGLSVILVSSELEEVAEQSDRVLVLARQGLVATLSREEATVERMLSLIFAVEGAA
ncbi:MAG: sugar ABC transporter ATP-binding protein [Rhizobiaceae bacterium]